MKKTLEKINVKTRKNKNIHQIQSSEDKEQVINEDVNSTLYYCITYMLIFLL